jgi:Asp-tRNA(Asn)/Glu-tRNA(Gln) amidotransferase A subunit family amidase
LPPKLFEGQQAAVVTELQKLGAIVLGKTVTTEFAFMEPGPTCNPHHLQHTPGGSSSGSAAAVACDYCSLALGTQTIGSISRPASYCGVVGFKPSYEGISRRGVVPFSASADHVGFFTHTVAGARFVASLLVKDFFAENRTAECYRKPILGIPEGPYLAQAEPAGLAHFEETVEKLVSAGFETRRVPMFADIAEIDMFHRSMIVSELAEVHDKWFASHRDLYRPGTLAAIEAGRCVSAGERERAKEHRFLLRRHIEHMMAENAVDVWLSPAAFNVAPEGLSHTGSPNMNLPWTHAGVPTLSLPSGYSPLGLPFGLQLAGTYGCDALLLAWAEAIEHAIS